MFDSLLAIVLHEGRAVSSAAEPVTDRDLRSIGDTLRRRLSGAGLAELQSVADSLRRDRLRKDMSITRIMIDLAEDRRRVYRAAEQVEVVETRWRKVDELYPDARLYITLENGLDVALSRMIAEIAFVRSGRAVPWNEGVIEMRLPGGVEPGERRTFEYSLSASETEHSMYDVPANTTLQVTPLTLYGPGDQGILNLRDTEPPRKGRLDSLRRALERQRARLEELRNSGGTAGGGS